MKKFLFLSLLSINCYGGKIFYAPQDIFCATNDIKSCFSQSGDLTGWQLRNLDTMKPGNYHIKIETLKASTPNSSTYIPIQVTLKNGNHHIEALYKKYNTKALIMHHDSWKIVGDIAYCLRQNVNDCPLIED